MRNLPLGTLFALVLAVCAFGCATEPEPLDRTQPEALNKKMFTGEWYYKMTVVDTEWQNTYTFPGEETSTYAGFAFKARWEITQDLLNAYMIPQRYRDRNGNLIENEIGQKSMILSFRIKKHYDIRYAYNQTTREDLNVIVENTDRPWNEREYMEVDWSQSLVSNLANPTQLDTATGELVREPVAVWENVEFFTHSRMVDGAIDTDNANDVKIDTRKWNPLFDPEVHAINIDLKEVISQHLTDWTQFYYGPYMAPVSIKTRHSLMKATPIEAQTYRSGEYRDEKFRRFGFFRTEYDVWDPERGALEGNKQYLINRWDFTNGKKLYWYASPDFQEQLNEGDIELKAIALAVVFEWNQVIREALGMPAKAPVAVDVPSTPAETLIQLYAAVADDLMQFRENVPLLDAAGKQVTTADGTKRWKYEVGDLRYSFVNFIKMSPDASPLGYGPSTPDADTGEIVNATLNAYGNWVDFVVRRAMDQYDAASGNCTLDQLKDGFYFDPNTGLCDSRLFVGEYKGGVLGTGTAALTAAAPKAPPKQPQKLHQLTPALMTSYWPHADIRRPAKKPTKEELTAAEPAMKAAWRREVTNPTALDLGGFQTIAGTRYESMMVPQANLHTLLPYAPSADHPQVTAALSPARLLSPDFLARMKEEATHPGPCKLDASAFEPSIHRFVEEMAGRPRIEVYKALRFWIWYTTALHEMGHNLGLRHNFRGSADQQNFSPEYWTHYNAYWDKVEALRAQYQPLIDAGDPDAYMAYVAAVDEIASPHNRFGSTSIMDYMGDWVKWQVPVGAWDRAAVLLGYGDKVEIIDVREIRDNVYSCNGKDGTPAGLMVVADEPPGENCAAGGKVISCGLDLDGDGILDEVAEGTVTGTEVKTIDYACNDETGGSVALVEVAAEPASSICEFGGRKATTGVDVDGDGRLDEGIDRKSVPYASLPWRVVPYEDGDFRQGNVWDDLQTAESGRKVRYYMFCGDEKVFDDAFCTRFDIGVTATEITRNFIRDSQPSYFFKNFKRQRWNFDNIADGYYINKWAWSYYMYGKSLGEMQLASMRFSDKTIDKSRPQDDFWGSIWDGMSLMGAGPEKRDMLPGCHHNGGEDLLRASLLFYYYLLYDVLGRPDYGYYQLTRGTDAKLFWEATDERFIDTSKPTGNVPTGYGWGWQDKYDQQADVDQYYPHLERIGVELDKIVALEIMSIPAAMNEPLYFEKANGLSFWNSIWTNTGSQAWEVMKGLITDNFSHAQTAWCMKCDANCIADSATYPPQLKAYPVDFLEGLRAGGIVGDQKPSGASRCGPDEYPMQPGMDALFAIFPIFFGISGASHPWYSNNLADHMDSQVKGGNHRFDIPPGSEVAEFTNTTGTKTYQAVKPKDGLGISYQLVANGARIMDRINAVEYCREWSVFPPDRTCAWASETYSDEYPCCEDFAKDETTGTCAWPPLPEDLAGRVNHDDCGEVIACLSSLAVPDYCEPEGFDPIFSLDLGALKYRDVDRIEAMLIMMQDMIDLAGHYQWRIPGYLENDW